jgi:hypothetical protein
MLRRLELLSNEVRETTDTQDINSIGTYELMRYFRDAQRNIQKIVFTVNPDAEMFIRQKKYQPTPGVTEYDLPSDIYAKTAINTMSVINPGSDRMSYTLEKQAYREIRTKIGYALLDNKFVLSTPSQFREIWMNYTYALPTLSYRLARVTAVDTATGVVTVDGASLIDDTNFENYYEKYSIVQADGSNRLDSEGNITGRYLTLTSYAGTTFTFTGDLSQVQAGDWVVAGDDATTHSHLPQECESYLLSYVSRRIMAKLSSNDIQVENVFTAEERSDLEDLFANNVKDIFYPISSDANYLEY